MRSEQEIKSAMRALSAGLYVAQRKNESVGFAALLARLMECIDWMAGNDPFEPGRGFDGILKNGTALADHIDKKSEALSKAAIN